MAEQIAISAVTGGREIRSAVSAHPEERERIERAQSGDLRAFDWLINRYRDRALRLAAHVLRRPAEAEDVVQEAFLRAYGQLSSFRSDCSFYTWLYRIVVHVCLNRMRARDWRGESPVDLELHPGEATSAASQTETKALVEMLLDELSPPLRAALVLREMIGLEYDEIAETLSIPVGTVRSRLSAARYRFRMLWERVQEETSNV